MFKRFMMILGAVSFSTAHAKFCEPGYLIYHAEEKQVSVLTMAHRPQPLRVLELCKTPDGFAFYFGPLSPRASEKEHHFPRTLLKVEPESPTGGFNFTYNNIEYSLFEDKLSVLYLYNEEKTLIDAIELDNRVDSYLNKLF